MRAAWCLSPAAVHLSVAGLWRTCRCVWGGIFLAFRRHRLGKAGNSEPARSACVCMGVVTDMSHDHLADMSRDTLHRDDPGCWVPNLSLDVRVYGAGLQHQCGGKSE